MNDNPLSNNPTMDDDQPSGRPNIPRVGAVALDFQLPNASQQPWHLNERVGIRPAILLFYRGYW